MLPVLTQAYCTKKLIPSAINGEFGGGLTPIVWYISSKVKSLKYHICRHSKQCVSEVATCTQATYLMQLNVNHKRYKVHKVPKYLLLSIIR